MGSQRHLIQAQGPNSQIVNFDHTVDAQERVEYVGKIDTFRNACKYTSKHDAYILRRYLSYRYNVKR